MTGARVAPHGPHCQWPGDVMAHRPAPHIKANGVELDAASIAMPLVITHGRTNMGVQPDAPTASFTWLGTTCPIAIGDTIEILLDLPVAGTHRTWGDANANWGSLGISWSGAEISRVPRFTGKVATVQALEAAGDVQEWAVGCVGHQAGLGAVLVNLNRPAESDHDRVRAICAAAGIPVSIVGLVENQLLPDSIYRDALGALQEVAAWTAGLIWQSRDGTMVYGTPDHRTGPAQGILPESATLDGVEWDQGITQIVNHLVVTFGDPETQNTYRDDDSIAQWGFRHAEQSTKLALEQDADIFGQTIIIRRAQPYWSMPGVVVNSIDCTDSEYWQLNSLAVGVGVLIPIPAEPGPIGTQTTWTVEGWQEVWDTPDNQRFQFALSDRVRWGAYALRRWTGMAEHDYAYWVPFTWLQALSDTQ